MLTAQSSGSALCAYTASLLLHTRIQHSSGMRVLI